MKRPVIGITMDCVDGAGAYRLNFDYAKAVELAGGIPLAIPYQMDTALVGDVLDAVDGILFTGGNDLDPAVYGETRHEKAVAIDPDRQKFEAALLSEVERRRIPTLGICLGCQAMNVHRGGSLHQFLPDFEGKAEHRSTKEEKRRHGVTIQPDSILGRLIGKSEVSANSYHKQAVNKVGRGLRVTAMSDDGVIEALEDPSMPLFMAVQWHPERLSDEGEHLAPFKLLVEKAIAQRGG